VGLNGTFQIMDNADVHLLDRNINRRSNLKTLLGAGNEVHMQSNVKNTSSYCRILTMVHNFQRY
jgi:hypothetical protein